MTKIEIGETLDKKLPFGLDVGDVVTGRTFIASITRWGKSWTARKIVEECFGHTGIIIIDAEGEYISLRERYPFLIIGKDVPLQLETVELMAEKILESKISVIIDLSMTEVELGKEYVDKFLRRFFFLETTVRQPYLVVVEEAEEFGGEKGITTQTCVEILRNITKKGGKRGIGILIIAHRPAWVSKGIISQCANKALGRIDWPADLEVLENFARIPHQTIEKLPTLAKGEFCLAGDWVKDIIFVKVGQVKTTHLGFTPEIIPPSPKELQKVIESFQKALPEVIEKIKPTVTPIEDIKKQVKEEIEAKYKERIESILRTAEERTERKYRVEIDRLKGELEKLSRAQALQPTAPITDVLDHPIVRARILQLDDKARDLLTWIEKEPGHTREELAARLITSKDSVSNIVEKINRVFQLEVVVDDGGRPLRYKSMLKRLFLTDVAKREIEELERLQTDNKLKQGRITELENKVTSLQSAAQQNVTLHNEVQKIKEGFAELGIMTPAVASIDEGKVKAYIEEKVKEALGSIPAGPPFDEKKIEALIDQKVNEKMPAVVPGQPTDMHTAVGLQPVVTVVDLEEVKKHAPKVPTDTVKGKVLQLVKTGFLDSWKDVKEVSAALIDKYRFNATEKAINGTLKNLVNEQILGMKHTDRNRWKLAPNVIFEGKEVEAK